MASRFLKELPPELVEEKSTSFAVGGRLGQSSWGSSGWGGGRSQGSGASWSRSPAASTRAATPKSAVWDEPTPEDTPPASDSQDAPRYVKGERVRHRRFGTGAILGLSGGGKDLKVSVAFDDPEVGTKQLLVAFAGLERDWESA